MARFEAGEKWWIDSLELSATAAEEQQGRFDEDAWQPLIQGWIKGRNHVSIEQILRDCLQKQPKDWTQADKTRIARCFRALGWTRKRAPKDKQCHREWRYYPGPP